MIFIINGVVCTPNHENVACDEPFVSKGFNLNFVSGVDSFLGVRQRDHLFVIAPTVKNWTIKAFIISSLSNLLVGLLADCVVLFVVITSVGPHLPEVNHPDVSPRWKLLKKDFHVVDSLGGRVGDLASDGFEVDDFGALGPFRERGDQEGDHHLEVHLVLPAKLASPVLKKSLGNSMSHAQARLSLVAVPVVFGFEGDFAFEVDGLSFVVDARSHAGDRSLLPLHRLVLLGEEFVGQPVVLDELGDAFGVHVHQDCSESVCFGFAFHCELVFVCFKFKL